MKRVMILFFIVNILSFSVVKGNTDNLIVVKNRQEIAEEKINELNARIEVLEKEIKYRPTTQKDNGGYIYNLDQIYSNSLRYYESTIENIKWYFGIIGAIFLAILGFFKWDSDKKLKEEKIDIKEDNKEIKKENKELRDKIENKTLQLSNDFNEKIQEYEKEMNKKLGEETRSLENRFNKIIEEHEIEIKKIKDDILKDVEIIEFNTALTAALNKDKPEEKIKALNKLNKSSIKFTDFQNAQIYFELANQYSELKEFSKAISYYDNVIELDSSLTPAYNNRGINRTKLKQYHLAILDFDKILEQNQHDKDAYNNKAEAQLLLRKYSKALENLTKCLEIDKEYKIGINVYQDIYDEFRTYLHEIKNRNELEQEVYSRLLINAEGGFTIKEKK